MSSFAKNVEDRQIVLSALNEEVLDIDFLLSRYEEIRLGNHGLEEIAGYEGTSSNKTYITIHTRAMFDSYVLAQNIFSQNPIQMGECPSYTRNTADGLEVGCVLPTGGFYSSTALRWSGIIEAKEIVNGGLSREYLAQRIQNFLTGINNNMNSPSDKSLFTGEEVEYIVGIFNLKNSIPELSHSARHLPRMRPSTQDLFCYKGVIKKSEEAPRVPPELTAKLNSYWGL